MGSPFRVVDSAQDGHSPAAGSRGPRTAPPASNAQNQDVKHDRIGQKFFIPLEGTEAVLAYTQVNDILDVHTIVVPEKYRGIGLAERLAAAAFSHARAQGMKIIPTCPYVSGTFLKRHPECQDLVTSYGF